MGDAQSAQREDRGEAAEQEAQSDTKETPLRNNGQISELPAKADESKEELNGLREEVLPQVSLPPKNGSEEEEEEEEVPLRNDEEDEAHEEETLEMEAKQNDLNEGFKKFFSSISLKLTVKRGSADRGETERPPNEEEPEKPEGGREPPEHDGEQAGQEAPNNESSSYQTPVDQTSTDFPGKPDENTTETKEEVPASADEEPPPPPSSPDDKDTPFKKFFSTGLFSGLKKKKKSTDDEVTEKELMDLRRKKAAEQEVIPGVEVTAAEEEPEENQAADEAQTAASQEKVQSSPLKRLLSGSSFKRSSKKQRGRRSSDSRLSVSGEHGADLQSSTESAEIQKEEAPAQPCSDPPPAEEGAWSSFKKLVTPQKLRKKSEDTSASVEAEKGAEGEPTSEESQRRKDSSVSWEAVLCGSGRRRSRKTSDSEEETPQADVEKQETEEAAGGSNEASAEDEGSTWRTFKKLVTPKRKAKDEDEGKNAAQSEEAPQEEPPFSLKKLLSVQKNRRSVEKQAAPAEADLEEPAEEDETPAVVPLSEFDQEGTEDQVPQEADGEPQQDLPHETEKLLPPEGQRAEEILEGASANEGSEAPRTAEELEDLSDETSDLQALSDIPEEGVATEGAELDDSLAEKLVELTSEAITAPEPTDLTLTEETEMVSAVSQLSESSETSENATPVPAEGALLHTDTLLQEVSQTTSTSPEAVQGPPEEQRSERSASGQILGETADPHGQVLNELEAQNQILRSGDGPETSPTREPPTEELPTEEPPTEELPTEEPPTKEPSSPEPDADEVLKVQLSESIEAPEGDYHLEECAAKAPEEESETFPEEEEQPEDAVMDQSEEEHPEEPDEAASPEQIQLLPDSKVQTTEDLSEETSSGQADDPEAASRDDPSVMVLPEAEEPREEPETTEKTDQADVTAQPHLEKDTTPPPEDALKESEEPKTPAQRPTEETPEPEDADAPQMDVSEAAEIQEVKGDDASELENDVETPSSEDAPSPEEVPAELKQSEEHLTVGHNEDDSRDPDVLHGEISTASEAQEAAKVCLVESSEDVSPEKEEPELSGGAEEETPQMDQGAPPSHDLQSAEGDSDELEQTAEQENKEPEPDVPEKDCSEAQQTSGLESEESRVQSPMEDLVEEDLYPSETAEEPRLEPGVLPSVHVEPEDTAEAVLLDPGEEEEPVCEDLESEPQIHQDLPHRRAAAEEGVLPPEAQPENVPPPEGTDSPAEKQTAEQTLKIPHPHRAQAELQDSSAEAVEELPAASALHVSSINQEPSIAWLLENTARPQTSAGESAQVSAEAFWETKICAVEERLEGGAAAELPASEARAAVTVDAAAMEVASRSLRETLLKKPHLLLHEPLIGVVAGEEEFSSTLETTAPLEGDRSSESAEAASTVLLMHMPTVEYEENHRIQVQVKDVDVRAAQRSVESLVELGVTESREVIDVCHECIQRVEKLSAASHMEEEVINEVAEVTFHEVVQEIQGHFKQDDAGTRLSFEEVVCDLETTAPLEGDRISAEESSTVLMTHAPTVEPEIHQAEHTQHDQRHLQEHLEKQVPPGDATAEEPTRAEHSGIQTHQNQIAAQPSSGSNLGLISSMGNVEPPSSLSLEFKLNIQFGQVTPPAPPVGRSGAVQQADASESSAQNQNSSEAAEPSTGSPKRAALQDVGIQAMELSQPVEEVQTTERRAPSVQAADAVAPLGPKDKRSTFLGKPEPSQPKPEEAPKQSDEDNDQEVWLDAEEDIYTQEDPQGSSRGPLLQEPADELRGRSQTGPGAAERPSETLKPAGASDLDSEGEDFAVALEDLESRAAPADED